MSLPYRPRFLPSRARTRTAFAFAAQPAPEPAVAPAALYGEDPRRPYIPGPVLAYSADRGVCLFREPVLRDGPPGSWRNRPDDQPHADRPVYPPLGRIPLWMLALQAALLLGALAWSAVVGGPGAGQ
jgi:hypothetical protein